MKKTTVKKWVFNGESVLDEHGNNVCTKSNGHLISAAPDLLEACKVAVGKISCLHEYPATAVQMLDKAIHKAEAQ